MMYRTEHNSIIAECKILTSGIALLLGIAIGGILVSALCVDKVATVQAEAKEIVVEYKEIR